MLQTLRLVITTRTEPFAMENQTGATAALNKILIRCLLNTGVMADNQNGNVCLFAAARFPR
jgi:hypothetical protein